MEEKIIVQDVEIIKKEVNILEEIAKQLVINNDKDLEESSENLSKVKKVGKIIKERREEITKPMLASLSSVRQLFKPIEETCENVEKIVKEKIKIYLDNQNTNIDINEDTRSLTEKLEGTGELPKSIRKRTVSKIRVIDESLLPREYLIPNDKKIAEDFKNGIEIPGTEVYLDTIIESR